MAGKLVNLLIVNRLLYADKKLFADDRPYCSTAAANFSGE
jgi:hypothetical protein